jgi:hypothetical protein
VKGGGMIEVLVPIGVFVIAVALFARWKPGKLEKDLIFDDNESLVYECQNLRIVRYPRLGRPVSWPGSKIQITNKRVVFSQRGLMSNTYVIHEIALKEKNPPESLKGMSNWGLVSVFTYTQNDFSVTTKNNKTVVIFRNQFAPNLDRMEIIGVASVEDLMQAVA